MTEAQVTIAVPSFNQASYLDQALRSIFSQDTPVEVYVADGGSTDGSVDIIRSWETRLAGWRSGPDAGQASAINEAIARGRAPYVCWLNSDDYYLPGALAALLARLEAKPDAPLAYGRALNYKQDRRLFTPVWVEPFAERRLALRCIICQPATMIRRSAWEAVGGLDPNLHMAMDYDLWWRLYKRFGNCEFVSQEIAVNREHADTKTKTRRFDHYREAIEVVRRHYGSAPLKWWLAQPYSVWFKSVVRR